MISAAEDTAFLDRFTTFLTGAPGDPVFVDGKLRPEVAALYEKFPGPVRPPYPSWLVLVYRQALADNQDRLSEAIARFPVQVKEYGHYLASLDKTDPRSVGEAIAYTKGHYAGREAFLRDAAYFQFRGFWDQVRVEQTRQLRQYHAKLLKAKLPGSKYVDFKPNLKAFAAAPDRARNGFCFDQDDSGYIMRARPSFFVESFQGFVSEAVLEYLKLERTELEKPTSVEVYLVLTPDELATRLESESAYLERFPNSPCRKDVARTHAWRLGAYLGGTEYSPLWADDGALRPEYKPSYERFIKQHPATEDGRKVAAVYAILQRHGFRWSLDLKRDLAAQSFEIAPPHKPIKAQ